MGSSARRFDGSGAPYGADRLLYPAIRKGPKGQGAFTASRGTLRWPRIAERMDEARSRWGGESILPYPMVDQRLLTQDTSDATLFRRLGASRLARTVCAAPTGAANMGLYGSGIGRLRGFPRSHSSSCSGRESLSIRIHLVPYVREAQRRGARLIVVDPQDHASGEAGGPSPRCKTGY